MFLIYWKMWWFHRRILYSEFLLFWWTDLVGYFKIGPIQQFIAMKIYVNNKYNQWFSFLFLMTRRIWFYWYSILATRRCIVHSLANGSHSLLLLFQMYSLCVELTLQIPVIILANKIDLLTDNEGLINELTFFLTEIYNDYDVSFRSYLH